jgi:hypothetical protein
MTTRETIVQELKELNNILADAGHENVYKAPAGYFDSLADVVLQRIRALGSDSAHEELEALSPLLDSISRKTPYSAPAGYFEELNSQLMRAGEVKVDNSSILDGLKSKPAYSVPAGYFEEFPVMMLQRVNESKTRVVAFTQRKWFRYAAAALVIGFVAMIGILFNGNKELNPIDKSYAWVKKSLKRVSTADISEFVDLASQETTDVTKTDTKEEVSKLLKDVSDKEIQDFLNDTQAAEMASDDDLILN